MSEKENIYNGSFEYLNVWKLSRELRIKISHLTNKYPTHERYELVNQSVRAARSISANIAEGHGRYHFLENIRFCRIARGSLMELLDHIIVARDENYINDTEFFQLKSELFTCLKVLNGYISYLSKQKLNESKVENKINKNKINTDD
jgi:four helix bundle protein